MLLRGVGAQEFPALPATVQNRAQVAGVAGLTFSADRQLEGAALAAGFGLLRLLRPGLGVLFGSIPGYPSLFFNQGDGKNFLPATLPDVLDLRVHPSMPNDLEVSDDLPAGDSQGLGHPNL